MKNHIKETQNTIQVEFSMFGFFGSGFFGANPPLIFFLEVNFIKNIMLMISLCVNVENHLQK